MSFGLLKKSKLENVQRRSQRSPLRRVQPRQERDEEELDYYSRGSRASFPSRRRPRDEEATYYSHHGDKSSQDNQRRLRQIWEEQPISKPKAFSKSYTANPVAKGKAKVSTLKARDIGEIEPKEAEVVFDSLSSSEKKKIYQDQLLLESKNEEAILSKEILKGAEPVKPCHHQTEEEIESNYIPSLDENCEELVTKGHLLGARTSWCEQTKTHEQENNSEDGAAKLELLVGKGSPNTPAQRERNVQWEKLFHTTCHIQVKGKPHGVIFPMLIKERPPDLYQHFLAQDCTVSRTKLFQEEEYDVILLPPEKTYVPCSDQMKSKFNFHISTTPWTIISTHQRFTSKWNRSNPSSGEEVIQLPSQVIPSLRDSDIRALNNYFQPNQKESRYETNYSGILNHQRICENWNHDNVGSDLGDMNFTIPWICFRPYCTTEPKIMFHSPTQEQYRHKTSWRMLMHLSSFQQAQEKKEIPSDEKDTLHLPRWVNLVQNLKSSRPN